MPRSTISVMATGGSAGNSAIRRKRRAGEAALDRDISVAEQTFGHQAGGRVRADVGLVFFVNAQDELDALRRSAGCGFSADLLDVADGDAVQAHGGAGTDAFDFGQIRVEAVFRSENSRAGNIKDRHRQNKQAREHEETYPQFRPA